MIETRVVEGLPPATETGAEEAASDTNAEEPAFEALYRTHAKRIYSLAYRFAGNAADAEELLQDLFLQAYRKLDSFRREAALPDPVRSPPPDTPGGAVLPTAAGGLGPFEPAYVSAIRDLEQLAGARAPRPSGGADRSCREPGGGGTRDRREPFRGRGRTGKRSGSQPAPGRVGAQARAAADERGPGARTNRMKMNRGTGGNTP